MAFLRVAVRSSVSSKFASRHLLKFYLKNRSVVAVETVAPFACKSTHATGAIGLDSTVEKSVSRRDKLDLSFEDSVAAFKSKTNWEIFRAYIVYTICSSNYVVENNMKIRLQEGVEKKFLSKVVALTDHRSTSVAGLLETSEEPYALLSQPLLVGP
ncbi:hypothetical protein J437_LFUL014992 [Ladona fulva]|uniref:Uncharacterized protein n=1 Tax=Ladona fulva TaxID=123851 RepID=A0A8K0PC17_LADFU|nr:hypothetical protein J437_LFUL014992 [Ladona fulva]